MIEGQSGLSKQCLGCASALLPYFADANVTDLLINGIDSLYIERGGILERQQNPFPDTRALSDFVERLLIPLGRRLDAASPYADGKMSDGSRFHILASPLAVGGPFVSIRKARAVDGIRLEAFGEGRTLAWLEQRLRDRANLLICGSTGAGKTTLLGCLLDRVAPEERVVVIEECMEIRAKHPHLLRLESRSATPEGLGEVTLRTLLRNALRMRPDRIVLGECRGAEAFDLVQAMNTGHAGSMGTLHANSVREALSRLEALVLLSGVAASVKAVREWISGGIQAVIFVEKAGGTRRIIEAAQVLGLEGETYRLYPFLTRRPTQPELA